METKLVELGMLGGIRNYRVCGPLFPYVMI